MISKTLKTLSGTVKIKIPENLNEITIGQAIEAENWTEESDCVPYIPGLTKDVTDNIIDFNQLIDIRDRTLSLAHQIQYCYNENQIPKYITFGTKKVKQLWWFKTIPNKVKVITNLSIEPAGAYLSSRDIIVEEINKHISIYGEDKWQESFKPGFDVCASVLANYFYCPVTSELWNEQRAADFKSEILKLSIQDAMPIACFFFRNFNNLYRPKTTAYQLFRQILKRKAALRRLRSSRI